jgi:hypothetical protein
MKPWQKKENKDAELFKGRRTPKSGGFWAFAGDVVTKDFLIDSKVTDKKGFRITGNIWRKLFNEALKARRLPLLSILLRSEGFELVVLDKNDFLSFLKKNANLENIYKKP